MYSVTEKVKAFKPLANEIWERFEDRIGPLKYSVRLLRRKIYIKLKLEEQVEFFIGAWKLYIVVVNTGLFLWTCFCLSRSGIMSKSVWGWINVGIVGTFELYKLLWFMIRKLQNWLLDNVINRGRVFHNIESEKEFARTVSTKERILTWIWRRVRERNQSQEQKLHETYEQEEITKQWFMKEENKKWRWFWGGCMIFWFGVLAIAYEMFDQFSQIQFFYPMAFALFFYEKWIQYEWMTREEYYRIEFQMKPINKVTIAMMGAGLKQCMPDALLGFDSSRHKEQEMTEEELYSVLQEDCHEKKIMRKFCQRRPDVLMKGRGLLESALELLSGHSVLFKTFFYKDIDYAFLLPAYLKLIRGETILLVCSVKTEINELICWMQDEIKNINGLDWWEFSRYQPFHEPGSVVAVYCSDFHSFYEDDAYMKFREKVGLIFLQDPLGYTADSKEEIKKFYVHRERTGEICLAVCSGSAETLEQFSWGFREGSICKGQFWKPGKNILAMYWKEEFYNRRGGEKREIEEELLRYLTKEVGADKIVWASGGILPIWDILWAYRRYKGIDIDSRILSTSYGYELQLKDETCIIAADYMGNYTKMFEMLVSRGINQILIHVVVPGYLLRDYVKDHRKDLLLREGLSFGKARTERSVVQDIFRKLAGGWVSAEQIMTELELAGCMWENLIWKLKNLFHRYILESGVDIMLENHFFDKEYFHICVNDQIREVLQRCEKIRFISDYEDVEDIETDLTYNTIFQRHLPGQCLVLKNKSYRFLGIIRKGGSYFVKVERNIGNVAIHNYYRQMREFTLKNRKKLVQETKYSSNELIERWEYEEADILVCTRAYLDMPMFLDIDHAVKVLCDSVPCREYRGKRYIKITVKESEKSILRVIGTWLKEALYTLCPEAVDYLGVCVEGCEDSASIYQIILSGDKIGEEAGCIYIIEDREEDSGILQDMYRKQREIISIMKNYFEEYEADKMQDFLQAVDWKGFLDEESRSR